MVTPQAVVYPMSSGRRRDVGKVREAIMERKEFLCAGPHKAPVREACDQDDVITPLLGQ
jgi:hypothetical protein